MSKQNYSNNELYEATPLLLTEKFKQADTLRFLSLSQIENRDCFQIRERLFGNSDVKTIYGKAKLF